MQLATAGRVEKEMAEKGVAEQGVLLVGLLIALNCCLVHGIPLLLFFFFFNTWSFCQSILYLKREFLLDMDNIFWCNLLYTESL